jgi:hypothetical protein
MRFYATTDKNGNVLKLGWLAHGLAIFGAGLFVGGGVAFLLLSGSPGRFIFAALAVLAGWLQYVTIIDQFKTDNRLRPPSNTWGS